MKDAQIDAYTADYTGASGESLKTAIYLRLMTPLGSWWADPLLGSRLYELQRNKNTARVRILAKQYSEQALQPLIKEKRAQSITVSVTSMEKDQSGAGRVELQVDVVDAHGQSYSYLYPVRVS